MITIRKAKVRDLEKVREMHLEFMEYHAKLDPMLEIVKNSKTHSMVYLRRYVYATQKTLFVAESSGKLVGFIDCLVFRKPPIYKYRDIGFIPDAFVRKEMRNKGVSGKMLEACFAWLKDRKIKHVELNMLANNKLAVKAWGDAGFKGAFLRKRKTI